MARSSLDDVGHIDVEHQAVGPAGIGQLAGSHAEGQGEGSLGAEAAHELDHRGEPGERTAGDDDLAAGHEGAHQRAVVVDIHGRTG